MMSRILERVGEVWSAISGKEAAGRDEARLDLRTFIAQSLDDIVGGVRDAQGLPDGRLVNPEAQNADGKALRAATIVKFDLLIGITSSVGLDGRAAGKAGITVINGDAAVGGRRSRDEKRESRIQFEIPIVLPLHGENRFNEDGLPIPSPPNKYGDTVRFAGPIVMKSSNES